MTGESTTRPRECVNKSATRFFTISADIVQAADLMTHSDLVVDSPITGCVAAEAGGC